jgi:aspartokinase
LIDVRRKALTAVEKNRLKGINISSELGLLNLFGFEAFPVSVFSLIQSFNKNRINLPFLSTSFSRKERMTTSCCFSLQDTDRVKELVRNNEYLENHFCFTDSVGLLSVFPHSSSLNLLGISLSALGQANLSLFGMASSISSLVFVLKYNEMGKAVDSLKSCCFPPVDTHRITWQAS